MHKFDEVQSSQQTESLAAELEKCKQQDESFFGRFYFWVCLLNPISTPKRGGGGGG